MNDVEAGYLIECVIDECVCRNCWTDSPYVSIEEENHKKLMTWIKERYKLKKGEVKK